MSTSSVITLSSLRRQAKQRADMENSNFLSITEWNDNLTKSYKELYDLLIAAYGNDYYVATPYEFTTDGTNELYGLPADFYKLLGVDLQVSGQDWVTLKPFTMAERNRYNSSVLSYYAGTNLRYRISGSNLWLKPFPASGQTLRLWYAPEPTSFQFDFTGTTNSTTTISGVTDTSFLSVGMVVVGTYIPTGAKIASIIEDTSITLDQAATGSETGTELIAYNNQATIDGISGWEEYVIIDGAIKAKVKEESDITELYAAKKDMKDRLTIMANDRDVGMPSTVADTQNYGDRWGFNDDAAVY